MPVVASYSQKSSWADLFTEYGTVTLRIGLNWIKENRFWNKFAVVRVCSCCGSRHDNLVFSTSNSDSTQLSHIFNFWGLEAYLWVKISGKYVLNLILGDRIRGSTSNVTISHRHSGKFSSPGSDSSWKTMYSIWGGAVSCQFPHPPIHHGPNGCCLAAGWLDGLAGWLLASQLEGGLLPAVNPWKKYEGEWASEKIDEDE